MQAKGKESCSGSPFSCFKAIAQPPSTGSKHRLFAKAKALDGFLWLGLVFKQFFPHRFFLRLNRGQWSRGRFLPLAKVFRPDDLHEIAAA